jgi:hypothetical protein
MNGAESHAFGPGASDFEQLPYNERAFDHTLLGQEFFQRQKLFGDFMRSEVGAFHLHQAVTAGLNARQGEPQYVEQSDGSLRRYYSYVNYDPVPGDSDQRRFIRLGEHITPQGIHVPLMSVARMHEAERGLRPASSFVRREMGQVHNILQGGISAPGTRSLMEMFIGQDSRGEWVQEQLALQKDYIYWLRAVAAYIGVPPVMRQFVARPPQDISRN